MRKVMFLLVLIIATISLKAQDTTATSITDSTRMYTYKNTYVATRSISIVPPGNFRGVVVGSDSAKWMTTVMLSVYASQADKKSGRPELYAYQVTLVTDDMPTWKQIQARVKVSIK